MGFPSMDLPFQKMVDPYWLLLEMVYPTHIARTEGTLDPPKGALERVVSRGFICIEAVVEADHRLCDADDDDDDDDEPGLDFLDS